jgi:hypothetical protein
VAFRASGPPMILADDQRIGVWGAKNSGRPPESLDLQAEPSFCTHRLRGRQRETLIHVRECLVSRRNRSFETLHLPVVV